MPSILFICTANRFRSPLSEAFFSKLLSEKRVPGEWRVESAAIRPSGYVSSTPEAEQEAKKRKLSLNGHIAKSVESFDLDLFDLIIVMERGQKEALITEYPNLKDKIFLLTEVSGRFGYDIPDPYNVGESPEMVASEIEELISSSFDAIVALATRATSQVR